MTRINANIPPKNLTDQHLLAEHRELPRICDLYIKRMQKGSIGLIPATFTLGTGHVSFFLDKGFFTNKRSIQLYLECKKRGFNVIDYEYNWSNILREYWKDWQTPEQANQLIRERITHRINNSVQVPRYYGKPISKQAAINLLNQ